MVDSPLPDHQPAGGLAGESDGAGSIVPVMALAIPLIGVGIPFLAVAGSMGLGAVVLWTVGAVVLLLVAAGATKALLRQRHLQRMEELRLQLELSRQETAKLAEIDRVVGDPALRPGLSS